MYNRFKDLGIPTVITRTEDVTLNPIDRINVITPNITSSDDIVISNHLNAGGLGCPCLGSRFKLGY